MALLPMAGFDDALEHRRRGWRNHDDRQSKDGSVCLMSGRDDTARRRRHHECDESDHEHR
jgi:hypothetical protein